MIECNMSKWPIVNMHFGSYSNYDDVLNWLNFCDEILEKQQKFLIISSFSEKYQFEHNARVKQAKWFKKSKPKLSKWCLGMIRITQDPIMIEKINNPAMHKGMPFRCIVADNFNDASKQAQQILMKNNLI
ncbi:hypothetical protein [Francisella sp. SYW-9]|uniref:hypothetical protein n=1 Tax=Francisella sp. SYW-9 TaxID=2610888 RepID=UPI00123D5B00|nr:hypothetical protein [Francisella sp. SYW-9]